MSGRNPDHSRRIGFWSLVSIGIGGMVGGGIFSVIGLAARMSGGGTAISFVVAGALALLTSYSYAKLAQKFPSEGGTVEYLHQAFGPSLFTGGVNVLLCLSYVVMLALSAYAFASYGVQFFPHSEHAFWRPVLLNGILAFLTLLNIISSRLVLRYENLFNLMKILILGVFALSGIWTVRWEYLEPSRWAPAPELIAAGMIIFLAFQGFELIANAAGDMSPKKLPKTFYTCILSILLLYILIGIVVAGHLTGDQIARSTDHALAAAAGEMFGKGGLWAMAVAALFATASALNASLYGSARVSYILAKEGQVPRDLAHLLWNRPVEGLLVMAGLTFVTANFFDLNKLSTMGSAGFLIVYAAVNASNFKLRRHTRSRGWIPLTACIACLGALEIMIWYQLKNAPGTVWVLVQMVGISFAFEWVYRTFFRKRLPANVPPPAS